MGSWVNHTGTPYGDNWSGYFNSLRDGDTGTRWIWQEPDNTTDWLYIPYSGTNIITKIRYYISSASDDPTAVRVEVTYNGSDYEYCYNETSVVDAWNECILPWAGEIQGFRINGTKTGGDWIFRVAEVDLWAVTPVRVSLDGCVGFYQMQETTGTVAADSSRAGNDGDILSDLNPRDASFLTYVGSTPLFPGHRSFLFNDGSQEWIRIDGVVADLGSGDRTVLVWIRESSPSHAHNIISCNTEWGNRLLFNMQSDGDLRWTPGSNVSWRDADDGLWHLAGYTYNEVSGVLQPLVDGVFARNSFVITKFTGGANEHYSIGQEYDAVENPSDFWDGTMVNAMLFDYELSEDQFVGLYNNGAGRFDLSVSAMMNLMMSGLGEV